MSLFLEKPDAAAPALYDPAAKRWWSYGDLYAETAEWVDLFRSTIKPLILSFSRNDIPSVAAYLGALEAGAPIALLPENLAPDFKARLIAAYEPELIYDSTSAADYFSDGYEPVPARAGLWRRLTPSRMGVVHPRLALLLSTSGTTGNPKFVRLSLDNVRANACSIAEALRIAPPARAIASLPLHYSYGLSVLNSHLVRGASVVLTNEGLTSAQFWELVRERECDSFAGVPYSYAILDRLNLDRLNVPTIRTLTQAGGKLSPELIAKFHEIMARRGGRFFTMYGQTEATARIAVLPPDMLPQKTGSVGFAIPRGSISVDETGEIVYSGPNVMMGYAESRAGLSLDDTEHGRLRTGDLGHLDADGCLWVTGRIKREAKLYGLRVNLDDLESMVRVHGPAAVVSGPDSLSIYCEFDEALFQGCREQLASKLRIQSRAFVFHHVERLPVTSAGKIDYRALESRP